MAGSTYMRELAPILKIFWVMGGLKFVEEHDDSCNKYRVRIKWLSWNTLYAFFVVTVQGAMVLFVLLRAIQSFENVQDDQKLHAMMFVFATIGPFMVPILIFLQTGRELCVIKSWFYFEQNLRSIVSTEGPFGFGVYHWTKLSMVYTIVLGSGIVLLFPLLFGQWPDLADLLMALGTFYSSMLYTAFNASCLAVCNASAKIKAEFVKLALLEIHQTGKTPGQMKNVDDRILSFRFIWMELINVMQETGMSIYLSVGNMILINFGVALYIGYMLFTTAREIELDGLIFHLFSSAVCWAGIAVVCVGTSNMHYRMKTDLAESLAISKELDAQQSTQFLMNSFLAKMIAHLPEISFDGYFTVGKRLLSTLISFYITTLVVLAQLQISKSTIRGVGDILSIRKILLGINSTS